MRETADAGGHPRMPSPDRRSGRRHPESLRLSAALRRPGSPPQRGSFSEDAQSGERRSNDPENPACL